MRIILFLAILFILLRDQAAFASLQDSIVQTTLRSSSLNEDRRIIIHYPRDYFNDTVRKFPVMYVLDGTSQDQHTADKMDILSAAGLIPQAIVIGIPNTRGNRNRDYTPPFMRVNIDDSASSYGQADKFLLFIQNELIPFIDSNYRISGYRAISGNSAGGLFVMYTLLEKPGLFQARFCYSTPVWRFENLMVRKTEEFLHSHHVEGFLYMSAGEKETDRIKGGYNEMRFVLKKNRNKKFKWIVEYTPFVDHQLNALVSTSKGLAEWGNYLNDKK